MSEENRLILAVDDDEDALAMVKTILTNSEFTVITATNGKEALKQLQTIEPALVILDIMMPEMNGYEVVELMKADPKMQNLPVMMLTAKATDELSLIHI